MKIAQLFKDCLPGVEIGEHHNEIFTVLRLKPRFKKRHLSTRHFLILRSSFEKYYSNDIHILLRCLRKVWIPLYHHRLRYFGMIWEM